MIRFEARLIKEVGSVKTHMLIIREKLTKAGITQGVHVSVKYVYPL